MPRPTSSKEVPVKREKKPAKRPSKIPDDLAAQVREELSQLGEETFGLVMGYGSAFAVLTAIQIGTQHPSIKGATKQFAVEFGQRIETYLGGPERPNLEKLLSEGWGRRQAVTLH